MCSFVLNRQMGQTVGKHALAVLFLYGLLVQIEAPICAAAGKGSVTEHAYAIQLYKDGRAAAEANRNEEAVTALQQSLTLEPNLSTRNLLASVLGRMGRYGAAYKQFQLVEREAGMTARRGDKKAAEAKEFAVAGLAELKPLVVRLLLLPGADLPSGFVVQLDGVTLPASDLGQTLALEPGAHLVLATGPRLKPLELKLTLSAGEQRSLELSPERLPSATLRLKVPLRPPGLAFELDGQPFAMESDERPLFLEAGMHRLTVRAPRYRSFVWKGLATENTETELTALLQPDAGPPRALVYGGAAATGAALITAAVLGSIVQSRNQDPMLQRQPGELGKSAFDTTNHFATASNILWGAGGALAAATATLALFTDWKSPAFTKGGNGTGITWHLAPSGNMQYVGISLFGMY